MMPHIEAKLYVAETYDEDMDSEKPFRKSDLQPLYKKLSTEAECMCSCAENNVIIA